jgi:hypothetical protein
VSADFLYEKSEVGILLGLFALLLASTEAGFRLGTRYQPSLSDRTGSHTDNLQSALIGMLALLLGFTFAMSISRFETRFTLVQREANAIGTAALRADLLPGAERAEMLALFRRYVDVRVDVGRRANVTTADRTALEATAAGLQKQLWQRAVSASTADGHSVAAGLLVSAVNDLIDAKGERDAWLANHVPETVLLLLFAFSIVAHGIIGFGNGLAGTRITGVAIAFTVLVTLVLMVIIDLDRPRRGLILVDDDGLLAVQQSLRGSR